MNIVLDGLDVLHVLLGGVSVVHAQVAQAAELLGSAEVDNQSLAVADVQIAVGLRRKTGVNGLPGKPAALGDVFFDKGVDEVFALGDFSHIKTSSLLLEWFQNV